MAERPEIRPLSSGVGAEIVDFDFARNPHEGVGEIADWHAALDTHQLLLFRNASLDAETQVAFLETLGPALIENEKGRAYQFVSNTHADGILGDERFAYHSDHAFMDDPIEVISLFGLEIPESGTQTRFVNGVRAAAALPDELRERISELRARHIIDPGAESSGVAVRSPRRSDDLPHAYHPILWRHPRTGEAILYVAEQQTDHVESLDDDEGRALIEALFEHLYQPRFSYAHEWRAGDLIIFDNLALQHDRGAILPGTSRTLRRVTVGGTPVYQYFRAHSKWGLD
ncbi:MAG: TauD/TfdA family dioxygenase [bacterium]|nr:hypothetical protein [Deltaproteobacteria bacterium]MCP4906493.1 TauD/TfdA family dioxygenase [bacterium]